MSDTYPESNDQAPETRLPEGPGGEPVYAAPASDPVEAAALGGPDRPARDAHTFRWRDLGYLLAFYLFVGVAFSKLAIMAGAAMLHVSENDLQGIPAAYVAVVALSQALLSAATLVFLWLLVRGRGTASFWPALGWRAFSSATPRAALAVRYALGGAGLAILIQFASYWVGTKSSVPMEDLFRDRPSVLMMMALGILVAPLIEETLFRGCIYPVIARSFGMPAGIFVTGTLFGLAHSAQLAGAWKQVALVTLVGLVLTYVRARAGTVLASYCVHLGYNSLLFITFYFATSGLKYFPGS